VFDKKIKLQRQYKIRRSHSDTEKILLCLSLCLRGKSLLIHFATYLEGVYFFTRLLPRKKIYSFHDKKTALAFDTRATPNTWRLHKQKQT
jgi:hypothetical protein